MDKVKKTLCVAVLLCIALAGAAAQRRIVLGGKAVIMVADAVYLFPAARKNVLAVGGADQGLGAFLSSIDPDFAKKPKIDRNAGAEVYASLGPDLVVLKSSMKKALGASLDSLGIRQFYLDLETPEDYFREIDALGSLFGETARSREIVDFYRRALSEVTAKTEAVPASARPRVLVVQAGGTSENAWEVPPASWMQTRMVELAGGIPVWKDANPGAGWAKVNPEQVAAWNPDVVLVISYRSDSREAAAAFMRDSRLAAAKAVRAKAVYGFAQDFYSWDQPDTRWILGLQWAAATLHPAEFAQASPVDAAREFFSVLYGLDRAAFDALILPRIGGDIAGRNGR